MFFFSSRRRHTRFDCDWSSDVCSSDLMAVPAAVVRDGGTISAVGAFVEMAAKCGGTTPLNGSQHLDMLPTKPVAISFDENLSRSADDIGHLQRRPAHLLLDRKRAV